MANNISLANHLLIAMPSLADPNFERAVVYICEHHAQGTVGLIINRPMKLQLSLIFDQLKITPLKQEQNLAPLLFGGPVETERGFVIHRPIGQWRSSVSFHEEVTVTTSSDIIQAIAADAGPKNALITLGYAGWVENQLEQEVIANSWLVCPYQSELLYDVPYAERWEYAAATIGVKLNQLSSIAGHA